MKERGEGRENRIAAHRRQAVQSLKRCPLCGSINAFLNDECFKCSWHGKFDTDPGRIEAGLEELLDLCPELADAMAETPIKPATPIQWLNRFWHGFVTGLRKRIQFRRTQFGRGFRTHRATG